MTNSFGIYIHLPFCTHRCSYCDFYSLTDFDEAKMDRVVAAVVAELKENALHLTHRQSFPRAVTSVFLGGGTPSLFSASQIRRVLDTVTEFFPLASDAEITMEINPETVTAEKAFGWKDELILNRVSLGVQSFNEKHLKTLERLASPQSVISAVGHLKKAGFANLNLDIIFGIPGQGLDEVKADIRDVTSLDPQHLSYYQLTLKPGHPLFAKLPGEEEQVAYYEAGRELLEKLGYPQYEVSNFSRPGLECHHNLLYWSGGSFLGVGPSASSRLVENSRFLHFKQVADLAGYLRLDFSKPRKYEVSTPSQTALEGIFLEIRKNHGIDVREFLDRYGVDLTRSKNFERYRQAGWLQWEAPYLKLTSSGRLLADQVASDLV